MNNEENKNMEEDFRENNEENMNNDIPAGEQNTEEKKPGKFKRILKSKKTRRILIGTAVAVAAGVAYKIGKRYLRRCPVLGDLVDEYSDIIPDGNIDSNENFEEKKESTAAETVE